jgi:plasmid stability protein
MGRQLTVRGVPDDVANRLSKMSAARGQSINTTVKEILEEAVGEPARRRRLDRYITWTEQDLAEFQQSLKAQREVDDDLWR